MRYERAVVDIRRSDMEPSTHLRFRQYDTGAVVTISVEDDGMPLDGAGLSCYLMCDTGRGLHEQQLELSAGEADWTVGTEVTGRPGTYRPYIELRDESGTVAATGCIIVMVDAAHDLTGEQAEASSSRLDEAISAWEDFKESSSGEFESAEQARQQAFEAAEDKRQKDYESGEAERQADFEEAEAARSSAESARASAEAARAATESARAKAEAQRAEAESARSAEEEKRASSESARATAETARIEAESARSSAESKRVAAETARASAEGSRASAESARVAAEAARATAENNRIEADSARAEEQEQNNAAQAKNNADQAANNAAAQGLIAVALSSGEYDPDNLEPTIEPQVGHMYLVPDPDGASDNRYIEWMHFEGGWERVGMTSASINPVTTDEIDSVASGASPQGDSLLNLTGLSYLWSKLKTAFAALSHTHTTAQVTGLDEALSGKAAVSHKHAATDVTSGTLPVARGGTGLTSSPSVLVNLASTAAASLFTASPRPGVTGTLPIANGGTGATTAAAALSAIGAAPTSHTHTAAQVTGIADLIYPVGSLYWSSKETEPSTLFPGTTWTRVKDVFVLAAGDKHAAGTTGGAESVTLSVEQMPAHSHTGTAASAGAHTHTANSAGAHAHTIGADDDAQYKASSGTSSVHRAGATGADRYPATSSAGAHTHTTTSNGEHAHDVTTVSAGGGSAHENMPPYKAYYCWERIA